MQITNVNERNVAIDAERVQDRRLGIFGVKPVNFVEGCLDGKGAMTIDGRSSTKV
jgi:hypothetical protein